MARLINESGVLGDTIEVTAKTVNNVSFDKMIEAIHVMQERMSISGTTAKEASGTITGSLSAVKAAWLNLMTAMGDSEGDIEGTVTRLADTVAAFASNMLPTIQTALKGIGRLVTSLAPQIIKAIPKLFKEVIPSLTKTIGDLLPIVVEALDELIQALTEQIPDLLPVLLDAWATLFGGLITAFNDVVNALVPMIPQVIDTIVNALTTNAPALIQGGLALMLGILQGIAQNIDKIVDGIVAMIPIIVDALTDNMPRIVEAGGKILFALLSGIAQNFDKIVTAVADVIGAFLVEIIRHFPQIIEAGKDIIAQLALGLVNIFSPISDALSDIFVKISEWFKEKWEFIKGYGRYLIDGIKEGIKDAINGWNDFWEDVGGDMIMGIADFFGISSPSKLMRDYVGKNLALGISEGFTDEMAHVNDTIQNSLPRSFDTDVNVNTKSTASGSTTAGARVITLRLADGWERIIAEGTARDIDLLQSDLVILGNRGLAT